MVIYLWNLNKKDMWLRICALSCFLLFLGNNIGAQTVIKGTVHNLSGEIIEGAVVKIVENSKIISFGITTISGSFELKVESSQNKLEMSFEHLSYKKKSINITNKSQTIDIILEENITQLKEVTISVPQIQQRGDTLSYRLAAFIGKGDSSLEDAIKKLPGMNVEDNGSIKYLGKEITNFYIEGLDLLGGKYSLATKNLPASYVTNVEVLNNHQDVKMDKDLYSDNVALNIKLSSKAKLKPVGTSELLLGYCDDLVYKMGVTGMFFTPTFQSIVTAKMGNDKEFALYETTDHFSEKGINDFASMSVGNITGSKPPLNNNRFMFSDDKMLSINSIKKIDEASTIKSNINYAYSKTNYSYYDESQYYTGSNNIDITESISPHSRIHKPSFDLEYKLNGDMKYVYDKISLATSFIESDFDTYRNNAYISQEKSARMLDVKNNFSWRIKHGEQYWNISSLIQYVTTPTVKFKINNQIDKTDLLQKANSGTFYTEEQLSTIYEFRHSKLYIPFDMQYTFSNLDTDLEKGYVSYLNRIFWNNYLLMFDPRYEYSSPNNRFFFRINTPIKGVFFHAKNTIDKMRVEYERLLLDPEIYLNYTLNANSTLQLKSNLIHSFGDVLDLLTAPVQNSYTTQTLKSGMLAKNKRFSADLRYEFKRPLEFWFINANISYGKTKQNLLSSQYITENKIVSSNILLDNISQDVVSEVSITKQIRAINTKVSLSGKYMWQKREIIQEEQPISYYGYLYGILPYIVSSPWHWMEIDYHGEFSKVYNRYIGQKSSYLSQIHDIKFSFFPIDKLQLFGQYSYVQKEIAANTYKRMALFDTGIQYKMKNIKFSLQADNILNTKQFSYTLFNGLDSYSYEYRLRGRMYMFSITLSK